MLFPIFRVTKSKVLSNQITSRKDGLFATRAGGGENRSGSKRNCANKGLFAVSVPAVAHAYDRDDQFMVDDW